MGVQPGHEIVDGIVPASLSQDDLLPLSVKAIEMEPLVPSLRLGGMLGCLLQECVHDRSRVILYR